MQVNELMTRDVRIANPDQSLQQAAQLMVELDTGVLPVGENDRLVGMITDRDIAIRAVAEGKSPDTRVRDIMTPDVKCVFEDQEADEVSIIM
jgi:CBS domain-containing protein